MVYCAIPPFPMADNRLRQKDMPMHEGFRFKSIRVISLAVKLLVVFYSAVTWSADLGFNRAGGEPVLVQLKLNTALKPKVMELMYRSKLCKHTTSSASGKPIELDGYNEVEVELSNSGGDLLSYKVPLEGGTACEWKLSSIAFGVEYDGDGRFGHKLRHVRGGGLVVSFDDHTARRASNFPKTITGDLVLKQDYYPWVAERFIGGYEKTIRLAGDGYGYATFIAPTARNIYFEPVLHVDFPVFSVGPKVKAKGNRTVFTYPDGSVAVHALTVPTFKKLQAIRLQAEQALVKE